MSDNIEKLKKEIEKVIKEELSNGVRKQNIEIELHHFIKAILYN